MINIIIISCHLTPNGTLNEPQHGDCTELMYLPETNSVPFPSLSRKSIGPLWQIAKHTQVLMTLPSTWFSL